MIGTYNGGKGNIFQHLINLIPPHETYIEAFVGGGSVVLNKRPASRNILIDKDADVIDAWREHLGKMSPLAANGDEYRYSSPRLAIGAAIVSNGGSGQKPVSTIANGDNAGATVTPDGDTWHIICGDALTWLQYWRDAGYLTNDTFVYIDPPYLYSLRASNKPMYTHEMGTELEHTELLRLATSLPCMVMISGYKSSLYMSLLDDWHTAVIPTFTRTNRPVDEWLWMNYPQPTKLHDYTCLGDDFRERERIKRKRKRWIKNFARLPRLERMAIMEELKRVQE